MAYYQKLTKNKEYKCEECGEMFTPKHHGNTKRFCNHGCANRNKWKKHMENLVKNPPKPVTKICKQCGVEFVKNRHLSINSLQWRGAKFCSNKCVSESTRIKDGLTVSQRRAVRLNSPKRGSVECREKVSQRTKEGMLKPEVKMRLSRSKPKWSDERKADHAKKLTGKIPLNVTTGNGSFPNVQRGTYFCSKGDFYFRSKWEANYALYLDFLVKHGEILSWEYEAKVFVFEQIKFGTRSYRPDFQITNNNGSIEYHEIKGYMDARSKTKLKRMAKYYPETKLILVDRKPYQEILKKLKGIIKFN
jgi:hypothetical protein